MTTLACLATTAQADEFAIPLTFQSVVVLSTPTTTAAEALNLATPIFIQTRFGFTESLKHETHYRLFDAVPQHVPGHNWLIGSAPQNTPDTSYQLIMNEDQTIGAVLFEYQFSFEGFSIVPVNGDLPSDLFDWHQGIPPGWGKFVTGIVGDCDQNGTVDFADIQAMIDILTAGDNVVEADCNGDGVVDFSDVSWFTKILQLQ